MSTILTVKGLVTFPKPIRDAMGLTARSAIDFAVNHEYEVVRHKEDSGQTSLWAKPRPDHFDAA